MLDRQEPLHRYLRRPTRRRLDRVVEAYYRHVWNVAYRVAGNFEDANDVCQDVFLQLFLNPPPPSIVRSPHGYLAWCVVGRASRLRRAAERRLAREREAAARIAKDNDVPDDTESLYAELARLPEELRVPLELRYLAGLSNDEAAEALGLPKRTLEQRLHDGRSRLKQRLAAELLGGPTASGVFIGSVPEVPQTMLPEILRLLDGAEVLAHSSGDPPTASTLTSSSPQAGPAGFVGGLLVTKTTISAAGALALIVGLLAGGWFVSRRDRSAQPPAPLTVQRTPRAADRDAAAGRDGGPARRELASGALAPEPARASVRGVVQDEEGQLMPGVTVNFRDNVPADHAAMLKELGYRDVPTGDWGLETVADANGEFVFVGLLPGEASVAVAVPGMRDAQPDFSLEAGKTAWQWVVLRYLRRLRGRVFSPDGALLAGAEVLVHRSDIHGDAKLPSVGGRDHDFVIFRADARGEFDTGACLLDYTSGGGIDLLAWAEGFGMCLEGRPRETENRYVAEVELTLEREVPLELCVLDSTGRGLQGVELGIGDCGGSQPSRLGCVPYPLCVTDARGRVRVEHLSSKLSALLLTRSGFFPQCLELSQDAPVERVVILQPEAAGLAVTVHLSYEEPFPDRTESWGSLGVERQDENQRFVSVAVPVLQGDGGRARVGEPVELFHRPTDVKFRLLQSGRYRCRLKYRHGGEVITEPFDADGAAATVELGVALPAPYLAGVLLAAENRSPVAGRSVIAYYSGRSGPPRTWTGGTFYGTVCFPNFSGPSGRCETDEKGRFLILLPREECPLRASVRFEAVGGGWAEPQELEVQPDSRIADLQLEVQEGGAIEGRVVDAGGAPVPGETVACYDGGANLDRRVSDAEGRFHFQGLPPGNYALEAIGIREGSGVGYGSGGSGLEPGLLDPQEVFERRVNVRQGETTPWTIQLERDRLGAIEGVLTEDLPPSGWVDHVVLVDNQPRDVLGWQGHTEVSRRAFRIPNLHSGRYRVSYQASGVVAEAIAETRRGHVTKITLRPAAGRLSIPLPELPPEVVKSLHVAALWRQNAASPGGDQIGATWEVEGWIQRHVELIGGAIVVTGLPAGLWSAKIESPHFPDAWTALTIVQDDSSTETPALAIPPECTARVRCEFDDGSPLPPDARLVVYNDRGSVTFDIATTPEDPAVRQLSRLPPGRFTIGVSWKNGGTEAAFTARADQVPDVRLVVGRE